MAQGSESRKVSFPVSIWFVPETGQFHIARPTREGCVTTVNADPASARGHPHLFHKLSLIMQEHGAPPPRAESGLN